MNSGNKRDNFVQYTRLQRIKVTPSTSIEERDKVMFRGDTVLKRKMVLLCQVYALHQSKVSINRI